MTGQKILQHVSSGKDGWLWAADAVDGTIQYFYGDAGAASWISHQFAKAKVIAVVDRDDLWCVNAAGEIWHAQAIDNSLDSTDAWTKVPTWSGKNDAQTISVGADGTVWYAQTDGKLFRNPQPGDGSFMGDWVHDDRFNHKQAIVISVNNQDSAWIVDNKFRIWYWGHGTWRRMQNKSHATTVAAGIDGSCWYGDDGGKLYFYAADGDAWQLDDNWDASVMGMPQVLAVHTQGDVYCLNTDGDLWRSHNRQWQQVLQRGPDDWHTMEVLNEFEQSIVDFEAEYVRLYQALEIAGLNEIPAAIEALLYLCNQNIDYVLMGLHAQGQATPDILSELGFTDRTWNRFMEDSDRLFQAMYFPISGEMVEGNYYQQGAALTKADLLRGRFRQLARYVHLIGSAAALTRSVLERDNN